MTLFLIRLFAWLERFSVATRVPSTMAKVVIVSSSDSAEFHPWFHGTTLLLQHSAEIDVFGEHKLVDDPAQADIILFGEIRECGLFAERFRAVVA